MMLPDSEIRSHIIAWRDGIDADKSAEAVIGSNVGMVYSLVGAMKLSDQHLVDDLHQQGMMAIVYAMGKYKLDSKAKFSTYAHNWIKHFISSGIRLNLPFRFGSTEKLRHYYELKNRRHLNPSISTTEIAEMLDVSPKVAARMERATRIIANLDAPAKTLTPTSDIDLADILDDGRDHESEFVGAIDTGQLAEAMNAFVAAELSTAEQAVYEQIHLRGASIADTAKVLCLKEARVRGIHCKILAMMAHPSQPFINYQKDLT